MKAKLTFSMLFALMASTTVFSQNASSGVISTTIPPAVPALPATTSEIFRFRPGLVTQLDTGTGFDFTTSNQWFSLGRLTPSATSQTLYGFRIQRAGRGLLFGYSGPNQSGSTPTTAGNPFIQWVGNSPISQGNLEFRTSPSSTGPATDRLVLTLRSDLTAFLGETSTVTTGSPSPKMEIATVSNGGVGLLVDIQGGSGGSQARSGLFRSTVTGGGAVNSIGVETISTGAFSFNYGIKSQTGVGSQNNNGIYTELLPLTGGSTVSNSSSLNYGVRSLVNSPGSTSSSYGVYSEVVSSTTAGSINYGIYASATGTPATGSGPTGNFAGYFAGHIYAGSSFIGSDARLKTDIKKEERTLDKLNQLNPVTYNYTNSDKSLRLNLPTTSQHGFIAQELEKVYPELVIDMLHPTFNDKNEQIGTKTLKAVNYIGLISVLTESVKELSTEVTTLKEKLEKAEKTYVISNLKNFTDSELDAIKGNSYYLGQNTPNPFKTSTKIEYSLPEGNQEASILILNLNGQTLREFALKDKKGAIMIESSSLQKGMYLYSLIVDGQEIVTKKMIVN